MIDLYLEQTPVLISKMKQSLSEKDWDSLYSTVHKLIPSFSIMGINNDYEKIAKKAQDYTRTKTNLNEIPDLVLELEKVCLKACEELKEEHNLINKA